MFYAPAMISGWLRNSILYEHLSDTYPQCSGGIILLSEYQKTLDSACLYIGEAYHVQRALTTMLEDGQELIILSSGCSDELKSLPLPEQVSLIALDMSLIDLYNRVQFYVHHYLEWEKRLNEIVYQNGGLQKLLDSANKDMQVTMVLMNAGYRTLAGCYMDELADPMTNELRLNGYLSFESVKTIRHDIDRTNSQANGGDFTEYLPAYTTHLTQVWPVFYKGNIIARLVAVQKGSEHDPSFTALTRVVVHHISRYMLSVHGAAYNGNDALGSLVADLIDRHIQTEEELNDRLKQVQLAFRRYYHVAVVSFPRHEEINTSSENRAMRTDIPWNYVISQLEQVLPFSNITTYRDSIVLLIRKSSPHPKIRLNDEAITDILRNYDGYMMVGHFSKFLLSLSSIYLQAVGAMRLALRMPKTSESRVFYYENYSIYQNIELAITGLKNTYGLSNYVYLCHPALITILRYDREHNTNLCKALEVYLKNDRNAAEAARALYVHRNTMLYKIEKIEELLGQSLDDPNFRLRLLYSYNVVQYVTDYLKEDILNLKQDKPEEKNKKEQ